MNSTKPPRPRQTDLPSSGVSRAVGGSETAKPDLADALIDLLDGKVSLHPRGEAARDLGRPPAQGHLRADGVLAEVDAARPLRTCHVLGERDRSRPRWGSVAATLDLGPQIENLREAELDRVPRRLWLKRSGHSGQLSRGTVARRAGSRRPSGGRPRRPSRTTSRIASVASSTEENA